jgi:flagellar biogenesis protein FliO
MAYQFNKNIARIRAILPFQVKESSLDIRLKNHQIHVTFPVKKMAKAVRMGEIAKKNVQVKSKEKYDESFLDALIAENDQVKKNPVQDNKKNTNSTLVKLQKDVNPNKKVEDKVNTKLSGIDQKFNLDNKKESKFSIVNYFGKFVVFLGAILLFFYGIIALMKKGILKKGKLGFLNNTEVITVLNTTYIGPKRSLMLVKVHQQTFLISSTERGIEFLSEVDDTAGLLREGEREVAGSNFDTALNDDNVGNATVTLKDDITQSKPLDGESKTILNVLKKGQNKDQVRFSEQIKSKVRNLKPLQ